MIHEVFGLLKDQLNAYLQVKSGVPSGVPVDSKVDFIESTEGSVFPASKISMLLVNIEEETALRPPDLYAAISADGIRRKVQPEIRLDLYILFVAGFTKATYQEGLKNLSLVIQYFQNHRVLDHHNTPGLSDSIEQLILELVTLPLSQQNEVWNALRTAYHPSVMYRVKMVVFRDDEATTAPEVRERHLALRTLS